MKDKITTHISFESSHKLLEAAEFLLKNINDEGTHKNPNRYAYLLSLASYIEARLNEALLKWGDIFLSMESGKKHAKSFLSMNLGAKLDTIFFLYSGGTHITDFDSKEYQSLSKLISIRNKIAHSKPITAEYEIEYTTHNDGTMHFQLPDEFSNKIQLDPDKLPIHELFYLLSAAKLLNKSLDYEYDFDGSALCKKRTTNG